MRRPHSQDCHRATEPQSHSQDCHRATEPQPGLSQNHSGDCRRATARTAAEPQRGLFRATAETAQSHRVAARTATEPQSRSQNCHRTTESQPGLPQSHRVTARIATEPQSHSQDYHRVTESQPGLPQSHRVTARIATEPQRGLLRVCTLRNCTRLSADGSDALCLLMFCVTKICDKDTLQLYCHIKE